MTAMWENAKSGYVYVMASPNSPGMVKIGKANNPEQRRQTGATFHPGLVIWAVLACQDMAQTEAMLHRRFAGRMVPQHDGGGSEWFYISEREVFNATPGLPWKTTRHCPAAAYDPRLDPSRYGSVNHVQPSGGSVWPYAVAFLILVAIIFGIAYVAKAINPNLFEDCAPNTLVTCDSGR